MFSTAKVTNLIENQVSVSASKLYLNTGASHFQYTKVNFVRVHTFVFPNIQYKNNSRTMVHTDLRPFLFKYFSRTFKGQITFFQGLVFHSI